jgi:hypothetical protein
MPLAVSGLHERHEQRFQQAQAAAGFFGSRFQWEGRHAGQGGGSRQPALWGFLDGTIASDFGGYQGF